MAGVEAQQSSFVDPSVWFTLHHTHTDTHTQTSKATASILTPMHLWFDVSALTEGEEKRRAAHLKNVTKNCTRSMKLLCWEKAICSGERRGQQTESEICFNKRDF